MQNSLTLYDMHYLTQFCKDYAREKDDVISWHIVREDISSQTLNTQNIILLVPVEVFQVCVCCQNKESSQSLQLQNSKETAHLLLPLQKIKRTTVFPICYKIYIPQFLLLPLLNNLSVQLKLFLNKMCSLSHLILGSAAKLICLLKKTQSIK